MDLFQIIDDIAKVDPEVYDRFDSRRAAFRNFLGFGKKVTAAALPLALPALFNKAYGQTTGGSGLPQIVRDTLNLALQLEYLEKYFYQTALASSILPAGSEQRGAIEIILNDENLHIKTLTSVLKSDAIPDPGRSGFDYTGSQTNRRAKLFPSLGDATTPNTGNFTNLAEFLMVAQQFVDTGVRAYKGGAPNLNTPTTKDILEAALNIHSVEARHSSRIRSLVRGGIASTSLPKSWIAPAETPATPPLPNNGVAGAPAAVGPYNAGAPATGTAPASYFPAESNASQGNPAVNVQTLVPTGGSATAGAEAFDEPLDAATVKAIAKNFAANPTALFN
ncbi:ferritin-like domain-containing protein [Hymenobacter monticola]|uniref:Ferritin-like domain-containing protein n=1 Tax=Hymenobacter monticola TaxID=1705399 RepID=A0ABY4B870_9BACT|nr:ferritin-like domain-containing protein [Hymenobacter monticola]UOE35374.1 ferritin-like domain-containing protein [Hymenobacter monticola]